MDGATWHSADLVDRPQPHTREFGLPRRVGALETLRDVAGSP
jgi:hypothetical protein